MKYNKITVQHIKAKGIEMVVITILNENVGQLLSISE